MPTTTPHFVSKSSLKELKVVCMKRTLSFSLLIAIVLISACADEEPLLEDVVIKPGSSEADDNTRRIDSAFPAPKSVHQIDAEVHLETNEVDRKVAALKSKLSAVKGRIVSESMRGGADKQDYNRIVVRLPHQNFDEYFSFIKTLGKVTHQSLSRRSIAEDFEKETRNYDRQTQKQEPRASASNDAEVVIEFEKPYYRGSRKIIGLYASNFTPVSMLRREGSEKNKPDPANGGTVSFSLADRDVSFDIASFIAKGEDAVGLASVGIGGYTTTPLAGQHSYFNPWIAFRIGALTQGGIGHWVLAIEGGIEFFHSERLIVQGHIQPAIVLGSGQGGTAVTSGLGIALAL